MPNYLYYNYLTSQVCTVKEDVKTYETAVNINTYLNHKCISHGSTLSGRKHAYQAKMHQKKFIPVFIHSHLVYFPTKAQKNSHCIWINYFEIEHICYKPDRCIIYFYDQTSLICSHPARIRCTIMRIEQYLLML